MTAPTLGRLFVTALLLVGLAGAAPAAAPHPAVCRIVVAERDGEAYGSGTLVDARERYGLVVTNWHVVRDAAGKVEVVFPSGFRSEARTLKLDETWDLAALVVWRPPAEPAPLAPTPPRPGEPLTICGYGPGDYRAITGRCTDYYSPDRGEPAELVELDVEARQGDSGGPIFNARGELAGVLFGAGQGTTLGSFGGRVRGFLATLAPDIGPGCPSAAPALTPPRTELLAAATPPPRRGAPTPSPRITSMDDTPADPFLAAERAAGTSDRRSDSNALAADTTPRPQPSLSPAYPPTRPAAPRASAGRPNDWRTLPYEPWDVAAKRPRPRVDPTPAWAPVAAAAPTPPVSPQPAAAAWQAAPTRVPGSGTAAAPSANVPATTDMPLDLTADGRTVLVIGGAAAMGVLLLRAAG